MISMPQSESNNKINKESFNKLLQQYYAAHQISKHINLLDLASANVTSEDSTIRTCICQVLEPEQGWHKFIQRTTSKNDRCYMCQQQLASLYPHFEINSNCHYCYAFVCKKYLEGNFHIIDKIVRKNLRSNPQD